MEIDSKTFTEERVRDWDFVTFSGVRSFTLKPADTIELVNMCGRDAFRIVIQQPVHETALVYVDRIEAISKRVRTVRHELKRPATKKPADAA